MSNPRERILAALNARKKSGNDIPAEIIRIDDAIAIVERELPESQWQPIDTAPLDGSKLLLACYQKWPVGHWHYEVASAGNLDIAEQGCGFVHGYATHWMPLPEPMGGE